MSDNVFKTGFDSYACDGETITAEVDGFTITATIHNDEDSSPPWHRESGHGPVSEWTGRGKRSSEMVLNRDNYRYRYYDFAEACRIARRDGWGVKGGRHDSETARAYAARAAMADYEVLRAWCNDEWHYVGVAVTVERNDVQLTGDYDHALWAIECNYPGSDNSYLTEVAGDLAAEALTAAKAKLAELCGAA